jgi:hypothetical protein
MKLIELLSIDECAGVGRIVPGVNTTVDIGPGEIRKQAAKWGFDVTPDGEPPSVWTTVPAGVSPKGTPKRRRKTKRRT